MDSNNDLEDIEDLMSTNESEVSRQNKQFVVPRVHKKNVSNDCSKPDGDSIIPGIFQHIIPPFIISSLSIFFQDKSRVWTDASQQH